jgi:hypothetical protein
MKTIVCSLFILVTTTSTIWAEDDHAHHHASPQGKVEAHPDHKFLVDTNLKNKMETILNTFNSLDPSGEATSTSKDAGHKIEDTVNQIFATCKLAPDADTAIHPLLAELLAGTSSLKKGQLKTGKRKIGQALARYEQLFDHAGWQQQ